MQIITILLSVDDEGKPLVQSVASDGLDPAVAVEACRRAMEAFRGEAIENEVRRRVAAAQAEAD